ncbi:MAG TPA: type VI secretion system baseplate subunit TssE [Geomonas sp.]
MNGSLLDRLIDLGPGDPGEPLQQRQISYSQARRAVRRDLENLLNSKCFAPELPECCRELGRSIYVYGLTDFTAKNPGSPAVRTELRQEIERAIRLFEPRLLQVSVRIEESDAKERRLRFRIAALLVMDQGSEPVSFDTFFDMNRGEYLVAK